MKTDHFVQTFKKQGRRLIAGPPQVCKTPEQARARGLKASEHSDGVLVFSVTGEPEFDEFDAPVVMASYGEVPAECG